MSSVFQDYNCEALSFALNNVIIYIEAIVIHSIIVKRTYKKTSTIWHFLNHKGVNVVNTFCSVSRKSEWWNLLDEENQEDKQGTWISKIWLPYSLYQTNMLQK